jgi:hypothetical protein
MKRLLYALIIILMISSCSQSGQKEPTSSNKDKDMKDLYEANLATCKTLVADFEKKDLNAWASMIADSVVWLSPAYGDTVKTKEHWVQTIKNIMDSNSNLHLTNAQFLPGIDSASHQPDGSVRYYGTWHAAAAPGKEVSIKFYGTYDFNKDHKVISGDEFYDVGGVMNAVKPNK